MEALTLKRTGLIWRLANYYGNFSPKSWKQYTICDYRSAVLWGAFKICLALLIYSVAIAYPLGDFIAWVAACLLNVTWLTPGEPASIVIAVIGAIIALAVIACVSYNVCIMRDARKDKQIKQPSAFVLAYRAWKDKVCYLVKFE